MARKQKARPEPGKDESAESVPCAVCGQPIHEGDRFAPVLLPIGVTFDGRPIGYEYQLCTACAALARSGDEGREAVGEALYARHEGETLQ